MIDVNDLRTAVTLLSFLAFIGILAWSLSSRRTTTFSEAAALPFTESTAAECEETRP